MAHPLESAWAKADRAFEHAKTLDAATKCFIKGKPYRVVVEFEPETRWHVAKVEVEDVPIRFSAMFGDIIQNLRSALDHLAWQLARRLLGTIPREKWGGIAFPTSPNWTTEAEFLAASLFAFIDTDAVNILKRLKPYPGGDRATNHLPVLAGLSNYDKHRVVAGTFVSQSPSDFEFTFEGGRPLATFHYTIGPGDPLEDGTKIARMLIPGGGPDTQVDVNVRRPPYITFGEVPGHFDKTWLYICGVQVANVIREFEPLFNP